MAASESTTRYLPIEGFPGYRVGDDGTVWSCWRTCPNGRFLSSWRQMKQSVQKNRSNGRSYRYLNLCKGGKPTIYMVHRIVLEAFVGPRPAGMECRHLDGNPGNNNLSNLQWGTPLQNAADRKAHGKRGSRARFYTHNGHTLLLKDWARLLGIKYLTLWQRLKVGVPFADAIVKVDRRKTTKGAILQSPSERLPNQAELFAPEGYLFPGQTKHRSN